MGKEIYEALLDNNPDNNQAKEGIHWADTPEDVWQKYLKAAATLGRYHRKAMSIGKDGQPYDFFKEKIPPLESSADAFKCGKTPIPIDKMKLLVCLLRIIDSLDEQSSRTGDNQEVDFHLATIDSEKKELSLRLEHIVNILGRWNGEAFEELDKICKKNWQRYDYEKKEPSTIREDMKKWQKDFGVDEALKFLAEDYFRNYISPQLLHFLYN